MFIKVQPIFQQDVTFGYFIYGKKQENWIALTCGIALCGIPYFIPNVWRLLLAGVALASVPFIARRWM